MGQRHQIYVMVKTNKEYRPLGAFHHQWCYGMTAITNLTRTINMVRKAKLSCNNEWQQYTLSDQREIDTLIKAAYGVSLDGSISMVHNEAEYLINDEWTQITPENGDNNDGCSLIIIDNDKKEVRGCIFWPYAEKVQAIKREKYLLDYYNKEEQNEHEFINSFSKHLMVIHNSDFKNVTTQELKKVLNKAA